MAGPRDINLRDAIYVLRCATAPDRGCGGAGAL